MIFNQTFSSPKFLTKNFLHPKMFLTFESVFPIINRTNRNTICFYPRILYKKKFTKKSLISIQVRPPFVVPKFFDQKYCRIRNIFHVLFVWTQVFFFIKIFLLTKQFFCPYDYFQQKILKLTLSFTGSCFGPKSVKSLKNLTIALQVKLNPQPNHFLTYQGAITGNFTATKRRTFTGNSSVALQPNLLY